MPIDTSESLAPAPVAARGVRRLCGAWLRRADGSITVFSLFVFFAMFLVAGIAVDVMRVEHERVRMQGATDRAVLSATMMRENISGATPEQIVDSFMAAEGLANFVQHPITVREYDGGRDVLVQARARMPTTFMRLMGVDQVIVGTPAQAQEALGRIDFELVLVLDVSGSMNDMDRMSNLRSAVLAFTESLFEIAEPGQLGISIVPYSTEVVLPPEVIAHLNPSAPTNIELPGAPQYCIEFGDWTNVGNQVRSIRQNNGNANGAGNGNGGLATEGQWQRRWCDLRSNTTYTQPMASAYLLNQDQVVAYMDTLGPVWGTSIDLGVVTGGLFFDPALRAATAEMVANGRVDALFADRPFDWDRPGVLRAMVLMTDGENCCFHVGHAATRHASLEVQNGFTLDTCRGLRDRGVTIYSIAFEAPDGGTELMRACATSDNHFFSTSSNALIDIFRGISTHIQLQALRLIE